MEIGRRLLLQSKVKGLSDQIRGLFRLPQTTSLHFRRKGDQQGENWKVRDLWTNSDCRRAERGLPSASPGHYNSARNPICSKWWSDVRTSTRPYSCITTHDMQSVRDQSLSDRWAYRSRPRSNNSWLAGTTVTSGSFLNASMSSTTVDRNIGWLRASATSVSTQVVVNSRPLRPGADQFSNLRSTGILPVAGKHGQDARATMKDVTQLKQLIGPALRPGVTATARS